MRIGIAALLLLLSAQTALADQFIATFMNPNHPRNLNITITQLDSGGNTLDTDRRRLARVGPTQSTWAVIVERNAHRVCVTLRGSERATDATVMLSGGRQAQAQITDSGRQICPNADPADIEIVIINFQ